MNKKLILKLALDFTMTVIMILLMGLTVTGALWHEILGVVVLLLILKHNLMNIQWFVSLFKNRSAKLNYKVYLRVIINLLMTVTTILLGISSIIISRSLFSMLGITATPLWSQIHHTTAYLELILISIHVGLHWDMILNMCRKMFRIKTKNPVRTVIVRILAFVLAILGIKASFERGLATAMFPFADKDTEQSTASVLSAEYYSQNTSSNSGSYQMISTGGPGHSKSMDESATQSYEGTDIAEGTTLNDFLGSLNCTGCGRHCSLLTPQCGIGEGQAQEATAYFESYTAASAETTEAATPATTDSTTDSATATDSSEATTSGTDTDTETTTDSDDDSTQNTNKIVFSSNSPQEDSLLELFTDFVPIMGLYIAGTYYSLQIIDHQKNKKTKKTEQSSSE